MRRRRSAPREATGDRHPTSWWGGWLGGVGNVVGLRVKLEPKWQLRTWNHNFYGRGKGASRALERERLQEEMRASLRQCPSGQAAGSVYAPLARVCEHCASNNAEAIMLVLKVRADYCRTSGLTRGRHATVGPSSNLALP